MADPSDIKHYDLQGYSRDERIKRAECPYSLREHEIKSLNEIMECVKEGKCDKEKLENMKTYLDHIESRFANILVTEEREGIADLELKNNIGFIRTLKRQVASLLFRKK